MRKLTEQDISAVIGRTESGYTIKRARVKGGEFSDSDHYGIALAQNNVGMIVTWQFHIEDEKPSFYWGHYMENPEAALRDYEERCWRKSLQHNGLTPIIIALISVLNRAIM